jgi:hypothetical protein
MATKAEFEANINTDTEIFKKVTALAVEEFFSSKNVSEKCVSCGENVWAFDSPLPGGHPLVLEHNPPLPGRHTYMPLILLTCENCGFTRSYAMGPFLDWLKAKKG